MGEELARASHAALHLVEDEEQAELVGDGAETAQIIDRPGPDAALALDRLDQDRRRLLSDGGAQLVQIAEGDMVEAFDVRSVALEIFGIARRRQGRERAAMEGAAAGDDPVTLGIAGVVMVFADDLQRQLNRLRPRIAEEHRVGEGVGNEPLGQLLLARYLEQVRAMPQLLRLLGQRLDEMGVRMAEDGDGDTAG